MGIKSLDLEFKTTDNPRTLPNKDEDDNYEFIAISTQYGIGLMQRDTGYIHALFGPEAFDVMKSYHLPKTELLEIYKVSDRWYYPSPETGFEKIVGNRDFLIDDVVFEYRETVELGDGTKAVKLYPIDSNDSSVFSRDRQVVYPVDTIQQKLSNEDAIALWPLIKKAHR